MIATEDMLTVLQEVAAQVILPRFGRLQDEDIDTKTHAQDFVTVADQEAEVLLTAYLRDAYPGALVLGEEACAIDPALREAFSEAEHAFTVDPVDGTKNFVRSSPDFAVMVAELRAGVPVRSWIWQPEHQRAYVAERGAGAWLDGERLPALQVPADPQEWVLLASERAQRRTGLGQVAQVRLPSGSCGIDYPDLACGRVHASVYRGTKPWDHAPGAVLLGEVGAMQADLAGRPYDARGRHAEIVAAASREVWLRVAEGSSPSA